MELVDTINRRLELLYGKNVNVDKANFRLVRAGDQIENRRGIFEKWDDNGNFLGTESGIHEIPKYGYIEDNHWVVERLIGNHWNDVIGGDYVYEPVYAFHIFPSMKAIEFLLHALFNPTGPKTEKEALYRDEEKKKKEVAFARNMFDSTVVESALHDHSAELFDSTKQQYRLENGERNEVQNESDSGEHATIPSEGK